MLLFCRVWYWYCARKDGFGVTPGRVYKPGSSKKTIPRCSWLPEGGWPPRRATFLACEHLGEKIVRTAKTSGTQLPLLADSDAFKLEAPWDAWNQEPDMKLIMLAALLAIPVVGQYKMYSDWLPTNEGGVEYRWNVDDMSPRACTVQFRDLYKDGDSMVHVFITYRSFGNHNFERILIPIVKKSGLSSERILLSCTFLDQVEIELTTRH